MKCKTSFMYKGLALLCGLLLLSACATTAPKAPDIQERANARWEALLSGDIAAAYEYLSPGYRSSVSSLQYQRAILLKRVQWTGVEYRAHECTETSCNVKFVLSYKVAGALPGVRSYEGKMDIEEPWVMVGKQWYYVPVQ